MLKILRSPVYDQTRNVRTEIMNQVTFTDFLGREHSLSREEILWFTDQSGRDTLLPKSEVLDTYLTEEGYTMVLRQRVHDDGTYFHFLDIEEALRAGLR